MEVPYGTVNTWGNSNGVVKNFPTCIIFSYKNDWRGRETIKSEYLIKFSWICFNLVLATWIVLPRNCINCSAQQTTQAERNTTEAALRKQLSEQKTPRASYDSCFVKAVSSPYPPRCFFSKLERLNDNVTHFGFQRLLKDVVGHFVGVVDIGDDDAIITKWKRQWITEMRNVFRQFIFR